MERRALLEVGGATAISVALAAVAVYVLVGGINWPMVVGAGMMAALATAANYRARTTHSAAVADEAPSGETREATAAGEDATDGAVSGPVTAEAVTDSEMGDGGWGEETR